MSIIFCASSSNFSSSSTESDEEKKAKKEKKKEAKLDKQRKKKAKFLVYNTEYAFPSPFPSVTVEDLSTENAPQDMRKVKVFEVKTWRAYYKVSGKGRDLSLIHI